MSLPRILYIDKHGSMLGARGGEFEVRAREENEWKVLARYPVANISAIVIAVEGVSITGGAVKLASQHGIDMNFLIDGKPTARLVPASYGGSMELWVRQIRQCMDKERRTELARSFIEGKIHNQSTVLRNFHKSQLSAGRDDEEIREAIKRLEDTLSRLPGTADWKEVASIEAVAAQHYWEAVRSLLPKEIGFTRRLKRWDIKPGVRPDCLNVALNIGYTLLLREVWKAVFSVGLNPYYGFLHARRPGRMSLVLDLMEEFRPLAVDRPLIKLARTKPSSLANLLSEDADKKSEAVKHVWRFLNENMKTAKPPIQQLILTQARILARAIKDKAPYTPFRAKW
jgi:CRISPR-associated protein Cas1